MTEIAGDAQILAQDPTLADFGKDPWWLILIKVVVVFIFGMSMILLGVWFERRVVARMAVRPGLNQVGPLGLLQTLADGIKGMLKEDLLPADRGQGGLLLRPDHLGDLRADLARGRPVRADGEHLRRTRRRCRSPTCRWPCWWCWPARRSASTASCSGGWASGSTYPLLGGLRSSAQIISYEITMGLSIVAVFITAGTMSTSGIVAAQAGGSEVVLGHPRLAPDACRPGTRSC